MKTFKILFSIFLTISIFSSCKKDSFTTDIDRNSSIPNINIRTTLNGFVTARNGSPLSDATINILDNTTQTNELGFFEIQGLVNEKFAVFKIQKKGNRFNAIALE